SLLNDEGLEDYAVLAISEPYAGTIDGSVVTVPMGHHNWTKLIPTTEVAVAVDTVEQNESACFLAAGKTETSSLYDPKLTFTCSLTKPNGMPMAFLVKFSTWSNNTCTPIGTCHRDWSVAGCVSTNVDGWMDIYSARRR
ncbi:hypothetical protein N658DRAFT_434492, partial [Parathielavia hyrcaniae]